MADARKAVAQLLELLDAGLSYEDRAAEHVVLDDEGNVAATGDLRGDLRAETPEGLAALLYRELRAAADEADAELVQAGRSYKKWMEAEKQAALVLKKAGIDPPKG